MTSTTAHGFSVTLFLSPKKVMIIIFTCWISVSIKRVISWKVLRTLHCLGLTQSPPKIDPSGPVVLTLYLMFYVPPEHGTWWGRVRSSSLTLSTLPNPHLGTTFSTSFPVSQLASSQHERMFPKALVVLPQFPCFNFAMGLPKLCYRNITFLQIFISL